MMRILTGNLFKPLLFFDYIFNFADCLVVVGVCLFIIYTLFIMKDEKTENNKEENGEKNESDN